MMVRVRALESAMMAAMMAQIRQASLTEGDSWRSGQNKSKKKPAPKMVATNIPTNILYDAAPTKSLLCTVAPGECLSTKSCWPT